MYNGGHRPSGYNTHTHTQYWIMSNACRRRRRPSDRRQSQRINLHVFCWYRRWVVFPFDGILCDRSALSQTITNEWALVYCTGACFMALVCPLWRINEWGKDGVSIKISALSEGRSDGRDIERIDTESESAANVIAIATQTRRKYLVQMQNRHGIFSLYVCSD